MGGGGGRQEILKRKSQTASDLYKICSKIRFGWGDSEENHKLCKFVFEVITTKRDM